MKIMLTSLEIYKFLMFLYYIKIMESVLDKVQIKHSMGCMEMATKYYKKMI